MVLKGPIRVDANFVKEAKKVFILDIFNEACKAMSAASQLKWEEVILVLAEEGDKRVVFFLFLIQVD